MGALSGKRTTSNIDRLWFISTFNNFVEETNFENKCRLLLDLFKLQTVFGNPNNGFTLARYLAQ